MHRVNKVPPNLADVTSGPRIPYVINDLFNLDTTSGEPVLVWTGRRPALADDLGWKGLAGDVNLTKKIFAAKGRRT